MSKIVLILFLTLYKLNNLLDTIKDIKNKKDNKTLIPGTSETIFINYQKELILNFINIEKFRLRINIHSINCNINVFYKEKILAPSNLNIYSFNISKNQSTISITPITDIVDGKYRQNYQAKVCPIAINSYWVEEQRELEIKNKEENVFYFDDSIDSLNISYEIKNITKNNFVSLYFKIKETQYLIEINYNNNQNNSMSKNINESTYIYLNKDFLKYNRDVDNINGNLYITIKNKDNKNNYMYLKIIEEETVCLLEKNALNFGFITSKSTYQYYYTEVLDGEEGELMLHNKRNYGILHAKIVNKADKENNTYDIYDKSNYPKGNFPEEELEYDPHYLQLKFNYKNTLNCTNVCYLLITYEQIKSKEEFPLIVYEFTIISRTWNRADYISSIIDIPYNEYIIGCFGKGASREHYYSFYIPVEAEKIIIQL